MLRSQLASARLQRFLSSRNDYVERAGLRSEPWAGDQAKALSRQVMQRLASAHAYRFLHQFAGFFTLCRLSGVDPLEFAFSPPLTRKEARRILQKGAAPGSLNGDDVFAVAKGGEFKIVLGVIPRLACLAYILFETEAELLLDFAERPCDTFDGFRDEMMRALSSAIARREDDDAPSSHAYKCMMELVQDLERLAGKDFSVFDLTDDQVLAGWQTMAQRGSGVARLPEYLRLLASLTAEIRSSTNDRDEGGNLELDDPDNVAELRDGTTVAYAEGRNEEALAHPVIQELLTEADQFLCRMLLLRTNELSALYLSRARAIGFGPLENKAIEAKRLQRDPALVIYETPYDNAYQGLMTDLSKLLERLERLNLAAFKVLWDRGERLGALGRAMAGGLLDDDFSMRVLAAADNVTSIDALEHHVATAMPDVSDDPRLAKAMQAGAAAWKSLKRRQYFATLPDTAEGLDALSQGAEQASHLNHVVTVLHRRLQHAVRPHIEDDNFSAELTIFRDALASIHARAEP